MNIAQLARQLKKHHAESRSWRITAQAFGIENKTTAYRIACDGYDPADPELRNKLGLGPRTCPTCNRRQYQRSRKPKPISLASKKELLWRLANREVVQ